MKNLALFTTKPFLVILVAFNTLAIVGSLLLRTYDIRDYDLLAIISPLFNLAVVGLLLYDIHTRNLYYEKYWFMAILFWGPIAQIFYLMRRDTEALRHKRMI